MKMIFEKPTKKPITKSKLLLTSQLKLTLNPQKLVNHAAKKAT